MSEEREPEGWFLGVGHTQCAWSRAERREKGVSREVQGWLSAHGKDQSAYTPWGEGKLLEGFNQRSVKSRVKRNLERKPIRCT